MTKSIKVEWKIRHNFESVEWDQKVITLEDEPGYPRHPEENLSAAAVKP